MKLSVSVMKFQEKTHKLGIRMRASKRDDDIFSTDFGGVKRHPQDPEGKIPEPAEDMPNLHMDHYRDLRQNDSNLSANSFPSASKRRVKVSVYCRSPKERIDHGKVLQHSQTISIDHDLHKMHPLESQDPDSQVCNCLSNLSPVPSEDSQESIHAGIDGKAQSSDRSLRHAATMNVLATQDTDERWACERMSQKSLQAAMNMLSLSPKKRMSSFRIMLYQPKENDEFLNNYLYCSKPGDSTERDTGIWGQPCNDVKNPCGEADMISTDACCASFLVDTAFMIMPRKSAGGVYLGRQNSYATTKTESWLDKANERFDLILEKIMGNNSRQSSPWNISFQAPSLKKSNASVEKRFPIETWIAMAEPSHNNEDEKKSESSLTKTSLHLHHVSMSKALHEQPKDQLTEEQFRLIHGMSRQKYNEIVSERNPAAAAAAKSRVSTLQTFSEIATEDMLKRRWALMNGAESKLDDPHGLYVNLSY
jgi:hypothetical protein